MIFRFNGLSPGCLPEQRERIQNIIEFWNALSCLEGAGETTRGILDELQAQVSDCLGRDPVQLEKAESLTARAALLITGQHLV